jgi:hypothetical protein
MSSTVQDVLSYLGAVVTACIFAFALLEIGRHLAGIRRELAALRELLSQPPPGQPDPTAPPGGTYIWPCEARGLAFLGVPAPVCKRAYGHDGPHRGRTPGPPYTVTWETDPPGPNEPGTGRQGVYQEDPPPWQPTDFDS